MTDIQPVDVNGEQVTPKLFTQGIEVYPDANGNSDDPHSPFLNPIPVRDVATGEWFLADLVTYNVDRDSDVVPLGWPEDTLLHTRKLVRQMFAVQIRDILISGKPERVTIEKPAIESLADDRALEAMELRNLIRQLENELAGQEQEAVRYRRESARDRAHDDAQKQTIGVLREALERERRVNDKLGRQKDENADLLAYVRKEMVDIADFLERAVDADAAAIGAVSMIGDSALYAIEDLKRLSERTVVPYDDYDYDDDDDDDEEEDDE